MLISQKIGKNIYFIFFRRFARILFTIFNKKRKYKSNYEYIFLLSFRINLCTFKYHSIGLSLRCFFSEINLCHAFGAAPSASGCCQSTRSSSDD